MIFIGARIATRVAEQTYFIDHAIFFKKFLSTPWFQLAQPRALIDRSQCAKHF